MCHIVGPSWSPILNTALCTCPFQTLKLSLQSWEFLTQLIVLLSTHQKQIAATCSETSYVIKFGLSSIHSCYQWKARLMKDNLLEVTQLGKGRTKPEACFLLPRDLSTYLMPLSCEHQFVLSLKEAQPGQLSKYAPWSQGPSFEGAGHHLLSKEYLPFYFNIYWGSTYNYLREKSF